MKIAVIPARGGSKRIPRKNVLPFCGLPMIAYSIRAALQTGCFDKVVVSTDDAEISEISVAEGAEVPFQRPPELSDDLTPTLPVIQHAIGWVEENVGEVEFACCLYATAPFVLPEYLTEGLQALQADPSADFAFSVTSFPFPIQRALKLRDDGRIDMFWPEHEYSRSQDLPEAYHDAGQFYWGRAASFHNASGFFSARSIPVILPRHRVQDIDTPEDWRRAEAMFNALGDDG